MTWWSAEVWSPLKTVAEIGDEDGKDRVGSRTPVLSWAAVHWEIRRTAHGDRHAAGPGLDIFSRVAGDIEERTRAKCPG